MCSWAQPRRPVQGHAVEAMAENPIVFALANPDPEIPYAEAKAVRPDIIMAGTQ